MNFSKIEYRLLDYTRSDVIETNFYQHLYEFCFMAIDYKIELPDENSSNFLMLKH